MGIRRIAAVGVAAILAATVAAAPAEAATPAPAPGTCAVSIQLQKKLVIASTSPQYGARLTGDTSCFSLVTWDLARGIYSTGQIISFWRPNTSGFLRYSGEPATVHALPRVGAYSMQQYTDATTGEQRYFTVVEGSSNSMTAKYDSRIAWHRPGRKSGYVTLKASVAKFSKSAAYFQGGYVPWMNAKVRFQYRTSTGWVTATTVRANSKGTATARLKRGIHTWRAITVTSATVWGKATGSHRG